MLSDLLSKIFNFKSKWLIIILIALVIGVICFNVYLKFYSIDSQHDQLDQLYNENKIVKTEFQRLDTAYKSLTNNLSNLQTQITHGTIVNQAPKAKLLIKSTEEEPIIRSNYNKPNININESSPSPSPPQLSTSQSLDSTDAEIDADIEYILNEDQIEPTQVIVVEDDQEDQIQAPTQHLISGQIRNDDINSSLLDLNDAGVVENNFDEDLLLLSEDDETDKDIPEEIGLNYIPPITQPLQSTTQQPQSTTQPIKKIAITLKPK